MKKQFKRISAVLMVVMLLVTLVIPITAFAATSVSATQAHVFFDTDFPVVNPGDITVSLAMQDDAEREFTVSMNDVGQHWSVPDDSKDVGAALLGVYVTFKGFGTVFYEHFYRTPEGSGGSGTINIRLGTINPSCNLTVKHVVLGSNPEQVLDTDHYAQDYGTTLSVTKNDYQHYNFAPDQTSPVEYTFNQKSSTITFYYVPKQYDLTVKHVVKGSSPEVVLETEPTYTQPYDSTKQVASKSFSGYTLASGQTSPVTYTFNQPSGTVTFYYVPDQCELTVKHVVKDTSPEVVLGTENYTGVSYSTKEVSKKDFDNYDFAPGQEESVTYEFDQATGTVTFYYVPKQYDLTVKHIVQGSNPEVVLETEPLYTQAYGSTKQVTSKSFSDYQLALDQTSPITYTFSQPSGTVVFEYVLKQSTLTVQYLLYGSGDPATELHADSTYTQNVGTSLLVDALSIDGYTLKAGEAKSYTHNFTNTGYTYTFWYVAQEQPTPQSTLTVYYKLDGSGTQLHSPSAYTRNVGTGLTVNAYSISGYTLKAGQDSSYTHTFGTSDDTYTFWYVAEEQPIPQSTLTVYYKLDGSGTQLHSPNSYTQNVGTSRTIDALSISGYTLKAGQDDTYLHSFGTSDDTYTFWYVERESPPPATEYSTLTVYYRVAGSSPAVYLKVEDSFTKKVGGTVTVDAPNFDGYNLMDSEADSYTHTFTASDATYTFWYEEEMTAPEEEPPLAEPEETVEVPSEEPPLSELPSTGGLPMELFYGLGSVLLAAGVVTGRKNKK